MMSGTCDENCRVKGILPMNEKDVPCLRMFFPVGRVNVGDAFVVKAADNDSVNV